MKTEKLDPKMIAALAALVIVLALGWIWNSSRPPQSLEDAGIGTPAKAGGGVDPNAYGNSADAANRPAGN